MADAYRKPLDERKGEIRTCPVCSKQFFTPANRAFNQRGIYCSRGCWRAARPKNVECICEHCGKPFQVYASIARRGGGLYCSEVCSAESQKTGKYRLCKVCGVQFYARPEQTSKGIGFYCSIKCAGVALHNELAVGRRHWHYREWRKAVFERDRYTCQKCKQHGGDLEAHHIKSWRNHPQDRYDVENGITLCQACHAAFHSQFGYHAKSK